MYLSKFTLSGDSINNALSRYFVYILTCMLDEHDKQMLLARLTVQTLFVL